MNPALLNAILINLVIPALARKLAGGPPVQTKEQLVAEMNAIATTYLNAVDEWLATHGTS